MVALFNAIAKAKRETVAASEEVANAKKAVVAAARDDNSSILSRDSTLIRSKTASAKEKKAAEEGSAEGADKGHKWAALRDDYMMGQKLTVKVCALLIYESFIIISNHFFTPALV